MDTSRRSMIIVFVASMMLGFFVLGPLAKYAFSEDNGKLVARPGMRGSASLTRAIGARTPVVQAQYGEMTPEMTPEQMAEEVAKRKAAGEAIMKKHEAEMEAQGKTGHGGGEYGARLPDDYFDEK